MQGIFLCLVPECVGRLKCGDVADRRLLSGTHCLSSASHTCTMHSLVTGMCKCLDYEFCSHCRPFIVQKISFSNMVLVAVDALCPVTDMKKLSVTPNEVKYSNITLACFKVHSSDLPRRRPTSCINKHPKVGDILIADFCLLSLSIFCVFVFLTVNLKKIIQIK